METQRNLKKYKRKQNKYGDIDRNTKKSNEINEIRRNEWKYKEIQANTRTSKEI